MSLVELDRLRPEFSSGPLGFGMLLHATMLKLRDKRLTSIPSQITQLRLKRLILFKNELSSLPDFIGTLIGLTHLAIGGNKFMEFPRCIGRLTNLRELMMEGNQISELPHTMSTLRNLEELKINSNPIKELPIWITTFSRLKILILESRGIMTVAKAPRGISFLPCYNYDKKPLRNMTKTVKGTLRGLPLYDPWEISPDLTESSGDIPPTDLNPAPSIIHIIILVDDEATQPSSSRYSSGSLALFDDSVDDSESDGHDSQSTFCSFTSSYLDKHGNPLDEPVTPLSSCNDLPQSGSNLEINKVNDTSRIFAIAKNTYPGRPPYEKGFAMNEIMELQSDSIEDGFYILRTNDPVPVKVKQDMVMLLSLENANLFCIQDQEKKAQEARTIQNLYLSQPGPNQHDNHEASIQACLAGVMCGLCFGQLENPRTLHCMHSFCLKCLDSSTSIVTEEPPYGCPICGKRTYIDSESLTYLSNPDEVSHLAHQLEMAKLERGPSYHTSACTARGCPELATHRCRNCGSNVGFCHRHATKHQTLFGTSHDLTKWITDDSIHNCVMHPDSRIKFYCILCTERPMKCAQCAFEDMEHAKDMINILDMPTFVLKEIDKCIADLETLKKTVTIEVSLVDEQILVIQKDFDEIMENTRHTMPESFHSFEETISDQFKRLSSQVLPSLKFKSTELTEELKRIAIVIESLKRSKTPYVYSLTICEVGNVISLSKSLLNHRVATVLIPHRLVPLFSSHSPIQYLLANHAFVLGLSSMDTKSSQYLERTRLSYVDPSPYHPSQSLFTSGSIRPKHTFQNTPLGQSVDFPWGIAECPMTGDVMVTDETNRCVIRLGADLQFISSHSTELMIPKLHYGPRGIAISSEGTIAVVDCGGNQILLYSNTFTLVALVGQNGSEFDLYRPYSVAFDSTGNLYVADSAQFQVQIFDRLSRPIRSINMFGDPPRPFPGLVSGVMVDDNDKVYILCSGSRQVQIFRADGTLEREIDIEATGTGGWCSIFCHSPNVFGIVDNQEGKINLYDIRREDPRMAEISLRGCMGCCTSGNRYYATSLAKKAVFSAVINLPT